MLRYFLVVIVVLLLSTNALATPIAHLVLHSQPGDFIGGGVDSDITYTPETTNLFSAQIRRTLPSGIPAELLFLFSFPFTPPDYFALLFFGTDQLGIPIQPGSYFNAQRADFAAPGHPGLDVSFNHRGCNTVTGSFTIGEVTFLPGNVVNTFGSSFEQHCEGLPPALFGTFTYSLSGAPVNTTVPEPSTWLLLGSGLAGLAAWRRKQALQKLRYKLVTCLSIVTLLVASSSGSWAVSYTFTQIDVPGASLTRAQGINDAGQIVGQFQDATGEHGFLDTGGVFTTIDVPGATSTEANGINNPGQIVGTFSNSPGVVHGFVNTAGTFTQIDAPSVGSQNTFANGINNAGKIVGGFRVLITDPLHGFLDTAGTFTQINVAFADVQFTQANDINDAGHIVGQFRFNNTNPVHGFLDIAGTFTQIDVPFAGSTFAFGINDAGQIVGLFTGHGFLYTGGTFLQIDVPFPNNDGTEAFGINNAGQIVGLFGTGSGVHGFLATPCAENGQDAGCITLQTPQNPAVPEPSTILLLGSGLAGLAYWRRHKAA